MTAIMDEGKYQDALAQLRTDWGRLRVDPDKPGILRADNDPTTGVLVGRRAPLFAEIVNRALAQTDLSPWLEHDALCPAFMEPKHECNCGLAQALGK